MSGPGYAQTGQRLCYDSSGREIPCPGSGQDGEFRAGAPWPEPRFAVTGESVLDRLTSLTWSHDANPAEFPMTWNEALAFIEGLNRENRFGCNDWRLPNRRELRSLIGYQTRKPALPEGHPFSNLFESWYWSATTAAISPGHAWYVHLAGGRMFYGNKEESFLVWPVRGAGNGLLAATGQGACFDDRGDQIPCSGTGQDGETRIGAPWPDPRLETVQDGVLDRLTGLVWRQPADKKPVDWDGALAAVKGSGPWRLPNINELESLVDCAAHGPALPQKHGFSGLHDAYWSATTSRFEPDWAWALYLNKGAIGVGHKKAARFHVWPVRESGR